MAHWLPLRKKGYETINDSPEAITFSWELTTTAVPVTGKKPTASLTIDSTKVSSGNLTALEDILFGNRWRSAASPIAGWDCCIVCRSSPSALALSLISPLDDASDVAVTANIVLTFNNEIQTEAVVISSAAGAIIAGAKTLDATSKILTFNPTENLANATTYIVTVAGVVDIYGQSLAAEVKNFATIMA